MTFIDWLNLSEEEQRKQSQYQDPYNEVFFTALKSKFLVEYGHYTKIVDVLAGEVGFLGPIIGIAVRIRRGNGRVYLPKYYLGFPVFKEYQRKNGSWARQWS